MVTLQKHFSKNQIQVHNAAKHQKDDDDDLKKERGENSERET